jgi:hypothetical protein
MGKSTQHWTETEHDFNRLKLLIESLVHFRFMDESKLELIELILQTIYAEGLNFHGLDEPSEYSIYEMYLKTKDKFQFMQDFRNAVEQCMSDSPDNLSLSEIVLDVIAQRHNQRYGTYASMM